MSTIFQHQQNASNHRDLLGPANVILYLFGVPFLSVEQGTTFGLAKMLHESMGGNGQIIGLRNRDLSSSLACIVTQDQTILDEGEYDIILTARSGAFSDKTSTTHRNKNITTRISSQNESQVLRRDDSFPNSKQITWRNDMRDIDIPVESSANDIPTFGKDTHDGSISANDKNYTEKQQPRDSVINSFQYTKAREEVMPQYRKEHIDQTTAIASPTNSCISLSSDSTDGLCQISPREFEQSLTRKRKWQCCHCKKFFRCRSAHDSHQRTHTGEKPFQCDVCSRRFSHNGNLKQHMYIHCDIKPYVCDVCGSGFIRPNRLRDHKLSHEYKLYMLTKVKLTNTSNVPAASRVKVISPPPSADKEAVKKADH